MQRPQPTRRTAWGRRRFSFLTHVPFCRAKREISHMPHPSVNLFATTAVIAAVELALAPACRAQPLPEPTGSYAVGRVTFRLVDDEREFAVRVWYPARSGAAGQRAPWVPADQLTHEEKGFVGMLLRRSSAP